jgi:hypothetical protein
MTGVVFGSISKYIEIGNIVAKGNRDSGWGISDKLVNEDDKEFVKKRVKKSNEKDTKKLSSQLDDHEKRNIKHFSMVQNKEIYFKDIEHLKNKIMFNMDVP